MRPRARMILRRGSDAISRSREGAGLLAGDLLAVGNEAWAEPAGDYFAIQNGEGIRHRSFHKPERSFTAGRPGGGRFHASNSCSNSRSLHSAVPSLREATVPVGMTILFFMQHLLITTVIRNGAKRATGLV